MEHQTPLQQTQPPSILMLDSGIGGLSLYSEITSLISDVTIHYVGDNAALPYGSKSDDFILQRVTKLVEFFTRKLQPNAIVIACNTASTLTLEALRALSTTPIIGVVPAIKVAGEISQNRRIGLLATPATIERLYVEDLLNAFARDCLMTRVGSALMVELAELKLASEKPIDLDKLRNEIQLFIDHNVDSVVLGCTHFPLLREELSLIAPNIHWIDSSKAIAKRTQHILNQCVDSEECSTAFHDETAAKHRSRHCAYFTDRVSIGLSKQLKILGFSVILSQQKAFLEN